MSEKPWVYDFEQFNLDQNVRVAVEVLIFLIQTYQQFQSLIQKKMVFEAKYTEHRQRLSRVSCQGKQT